MWHTWLIHAHFIVHFSNFLACECCAICLSSLSTLYVCCNLQYMLVPLLACWFLNFVLYDYCHCVNILLVSPGLHEKIFISFECHFSWRSVLDVSASYCVN